MNQFLAFFRRALFEGSPRSVQTKQNIVWLFLLRGVSVAISLFLVPLTLAYLSPTRYGIWMTLSSILSWVMWLDVGLGNGLRNRFAEALAHGDRALARSYVSTTYLFVGLIGLALFLVFVLVQPLLSWSGILNAPGEMEHELTILAYIVVLFFCVRLVVGLIGTILTADQQPALSSLLEVLINAVSLVAVLVLTAAVPGSLFWLGVCLAGAMVLVPLIGNIWLFRGRYREFAPSLRHVRVDHARGLIHLGVQFFVLQLGGLVIFTSANIIITQLFGPEQVTQYNIAYKYFGVPAMAFGMLLMPFWSAYTDAFARGDIAWIRMTLRRLKQMFVWLTLGVAIMLLCADQAYAIWIGHAVSIPFSLSAAMALYVLIVAWSSIFAYFINGTGKIRLQLLVAVGGSLVMIPLALLIAGEGGLRTAGVVLAICLVLLPGAILWPIQTRKLLSGRATGIWSQ